MGAKRAQKDANSELPEAGGAVPASAAPATPVVESLPVHVEILALNDCARINTCYLVDVANALHTITMQWPLLAASDPMPLSNWRPEQDLRIGFVEPFSNTGCDAALEDASIRGDTTVQYTCGINLMWVDLLVSCTPDVPMSKRRVTEFGSGLKPGVRLDPHLVVAVTFDRAAHMPRGGLLRISPNEITDALLFKIVERLEAKASATELAEWERVLRSVPCTFVIRPSMEKLFAESNTLRNRLANQARVVTFSARQAIYNIVSFKAAKERSSPGLTCGAEQIAKFWQDHIEVSNSGESPHAKYTVDCAPHRPRPVSLRRGVGPSVARRRGGARPRQLLEQCLNTPGMCFPGPDFGEHKMVCLLD